MPASHWMLGMIPSTRRCIMPACWGAVLLAAQQVFEAAASMRRGGVLLADVYHHPPVVHAGTIRLPGRDLSSHLRSMRSSLHTDVSAACADFSNFAAVMHAGKEHGSSMRTRLKFCARQLHSSLVGHALALRAVCKGRMLILLPACKRMSSAGVIEGYSMTTGGMIEAMFA